MKTCVSRYERTEETDQQKKTNNKYMHTAQSKEPKKTKNKKKNGQD